MPSPVGHTLAGCAVALALTPPQMSQAWQAWALCVISANLADMDFIPGLLTGDPRRFHRGPSHSLMAAVVVAALGASLLTWWSVPWLTRAGLIFLAYASHVGLDYFTPGRGVLLSWPISHRRYQAAYPWFRSITPGKTRQSFSFEIDTKPLLAAIRREILLVAPGVAVLALARVLTWLPLRDVPF
jgi:LexA-binding, inner membrane-associated putative hydrolase